MKELIYRSLLVDPRGAHVVPEILRLARSHNAIHGITGILLFDGERFCQHLEGDAVEIDRVFRAIKADRRHRDVEVLVEGPIVARVYSTWSMAYALEASRSLIDTLGSVPADQVARELHRALPSCDLEV